MMKGGLSRADSQYRLKYSDLEYTSISKLSPSFRGAIDVQLFLNRSFESKTNRVCD